MRGFASLIRKDLKGYLDQPTGYILLVIFIGVASYLFFRTVTNTDEASLRALFSIMPWLLAVFVAATTMRLLAEEQRDGTLEILLTQPIRVWSVVAAKFLSGLIFVGIGIAATTVIPLTLETAGNLDKGAAVAQYIGTFFLTASFVSIGLFASSLTRNQIVAFIIAISVIMVLLLAGLPVINLAIPSAAAVVVQDLSPLIHFTDISRGVIYIRDVLYFTALVAVFLSATYLMVRGKAVSHRSPLYRNMQMGVAGLVVLSLLAGWFGRAIDWRWDLTDEKLYTLSSATEQVFDQLDDFATIKLYASKDPPVQIAPRTRDVNDLLDDLTAKSNGKLRVLRRFPGHDTDHALEAIQDQIPPVQFSDQSGGELKLKIGYLGMTLQYANGMEVIPFINNLETLEYQIVSRIYKMARGEEKTVAFLTGHGEKTGADLLRIIQGQLGRLHDVTDIQELGQDPPLLDLTEVDVLVVPGPTQEINRYVLASIDVFLANGGKALFLFDPVIVSQRQRIGLGNPFNLAEHLENYGVRTNTGVVFDLRSNETLQIEARFGTNPQRYPYWVRVPAVESKVSGGVRSVAFPWPGSLEVIEPADRNVEVEVTTLLETSPDAGVDTDYQDLSISSARLRGISEDELEPRVLAVAITGTRCSPFVDTCEMDPTKGFRMIVATNSEWISDMITPQYPENIALITNWVDWLAQEDVLAAIRSRGASSRLLKFDSKTHLNFVQYGNVFGVPALVVLLGITRLVFRRNTTRKVYTRER